MSNTAAIASILLALLIGAMSPGPSFVLVVRNAIGLSRRNGIATALGMGLGGMLFSAAALAGLYSLLTTVPVLYIAFKIVGGAYLIYIASKIWRSARAPMTMENPETHRPRGFFHSFGVGVGTQLSNPKTAIFYSSIFASLLPAHPSFWSYVMLPPLIFIIEAGWYTLVALCFSTQRPRGLYLRSKVMIDRLAAGAMVALGLHLILSACGVKV